MHDARVEGRSFGRMHESQSRDWDSRVVASCCNPDAFSLVSAAACQRIGGALPAGEQATSDPRPQGRSLKEVLLTVQRQRSGEELSLEGGVQDVATPGGKDVLART